MNEKTRLDIAIFERGLCESREKAKAYIMTGEVYVNDQKETKPGTQVKAEDLLEVRSKSLKYVSRGGFKLEKALKAFDINLNDMVCMDVGASTGGFTDCMLQNNAKKVYAIDVGYAQLSWKLRADDRVISLERTNFRYVTENEVPEPIDFSSIDVSFISLSLMFPVLYNILKDGGGAVCLIKPQFEAGREKVGKKGVVRESTTHIEVIKDVIAYALNNKFDVCGLSFSPIKGPNGNIEFLIHIRKGQGENFLSIEPENIVESSHNELGG